MRSARHHAHLSGDTDKSQPQKFHTRVVPRIGGLGFALGLWAGVAWLFAWGLSGGWLVLGLAGSGLIAFGAGLIEDFTKRVTPLQRLLATVAASGAAVWAVDAVILRTDIPGVDGVLMLTMVFPVALTLLAVAGVANSINIIDGFNGLASLCVAFMLAAIAVIAHKVGDVAILQGALIGLGAVLGFFALNYPSGKIFLGDGGAYLMGFWVAELGILLVHRNPLVSPIFPLLVCAYPMFETLFTMYRRKVIRGRAVGLPDATHLHSLVFRRLLGASLGKSDAAALLRCNYRTAPYLWVLCLVSVIPALLWWDSSRVLAFLLLAYCILYVVIYRSIVHFRTPRLLRGTRPRTRVPARDDPAPRGGLEGVGPDFFEVGQLLKRGD